MVTRVDKAGIEGCVKRVNAAIEELDRAAGEIEKAMAELPEYWEGASYNNARKIYEDRYQKLLTSTVPDAVVDFRDYINACMAEIIDIDNRLAGN